MSAQSEFDKKYISSREIARRLKVTRPTVYNARKRGDLPDPIVVDDSTIHLWLRAEVESMLRAWERKLSDGRATLQRRRLATL
jgi:predicted DNA-binding transcriptional regulator AlpA